MLGASMFLLCGCWSVGVELVGLVGPLVGASMSALAVRAFGGWSVGWLGWAVVA